ncbi:hypothetical protein C358_04401 [Cryptococcus neoformans MW-RSA852]|nr:hypothetical protein C358_04401 [Cryptococcus neoformans var. grubii MW-RSA852]
MTLSTGNRVLRRYLSEKFSLNTFNLSTFRLIKELSVSRLLLLIILNRSLPYIGLGVNLARQSPVAVTLFNGVVATSIFLLPFVCWYLRFPTIYLLLCSLLYFVYFYAIERY